MHYYYLKTENIPAIKLQNGFWLFEQFIGKNL